MADVSTSMFNFAGGPKPEDVSTSYQKGLTDSMNRQAQGLNLSQLANETTSANQAFQDQQAQRQALQQNVDATGKLDQPAAIAQLAQQNPVAAKGLDKMLNQYGIDGAAQHADIMQDFFAHATPQDYAQKKQELLDKGINEAQGLPKVYIPSVQQRGLLSSATGAQQVDMIKSQATMKNQLQQEMIKKGIMPDLSDNPYNKYGSDKTNGEEANPHLVSGLNLPPAMRGLKPGETIPQSDKDLAAQKIYDDSLSSRKLNDPAYATAGSNLLAVNNAMSVFNKYKDLNKLSTQDQHIVAGEAAKAIKGGASPTQDEVDALLPQNLQSKGADFWAKISSKPVPTNNAEFYQGLKDYFGDLKENSMNAIQSAHASAEANAKAAGINKDSLAIKQAGQMKELRGMAGANLKKKSEAPPPPPPDGRITVKDPNGKIGHIPQSQLQDALDQGYTQP